MSLRFPKTYPHSESSILQKDWRRILVKIQMRENKNTFPELILTQGYRTQVMLMLTRVLCQTMSWFHEQSQCTEHKMIFYFESSFFSWWLSLLITPLICHRKPSYLSAIHKVIERKIWLFKSLHQTKLGLIHTYNCEVLNFLHTQIIIKNQIEINSHILCKKLNVHWNEFT